jgi:sugar/nucleoside kinase (ribokinase family)
MDVVVLGNATLDVICSPVGDVPRHTSVRFKDVQVSPGGCGSNVAIGLSALGVPTSLVASIGADDTAFLLKRYWERVGLDYSLVQSHGDFPSGVSIGLVDSQGERRFIHTSGANAQLTVDNLDVRQLAQAGARALHVAGFFVLPGLLDGRMPLPLKEAQRLGLITSLDVVENPAMHDPQVMWPCLPHLDVLLCNLQEATIMTGETAPDAAAKALRHKGAHIVVIKLGAQGCWVEGVSPAIRIEGGGSVSGIVPTQTVEVVDTTGAGDAFAAGLVAALLQGKSLLAACNFANRTGARIVSSLCAISAWLDDLDFEI